MKGQNSEIFGSYVQKTEELEGMTMTWGFCVCLWCALGTLTLGQESPFLFSPWVPHRLHLASGLPNFFVRFFVRMVVASASLSPREAPPPLQPPTVRWREYSLHPTDRYTCVGVENTFPDKTKYC
jgi:hypothetical protein